MFKDVARPPFDAELVPVLKTLRAPGPSVLTLGNLGDVRRQEAEQQLGAALDLTVDGKVIADDVSIPGPEDAPNVTLLILRPATGEGPWPVIYHVHGGGMITGNRKSGLDGFLPYAAEGLAVVVSVEYRLAPENPDPAPVEDCYAGLVWTAKNAGNLSIDPGRIIIAGGSAGGGLAAGTALLARDRGFPELTHQVLACPMLDDRLESVSSHMLKDEGTWDRDNNLFGWTCLLGDRRGGPDVSIYAAPARAQNLAGLPKTYIDTGSAETFRDETITYAKRLSEAGVSVDLHMWGGGFHGFDVLAPHAAVSRASQRVRDEYIRRALGS